MDRVTEQLQERGQVLVVVVLLLVLLVFLSVSYYKYFCTISQVVLYLQRRHISFSSQPDQSLIGFSVYGRFGSALAVLGDVDMDGYHGNHSNQCLLI